MLRETLRPNARHATAAFSGEGAPLFLSRAVTGAATSSRTVASATPERWLRIVRSGTTLAGYGSTDGETWRQLGWSTVPMSRAILASLAVTSGDPAQPAEASFAGLQLVPERCPRRGSQPRSASRRGRRSIALPAEFSRSMAEAPGSRSGLMRGTSSPDESAAMSPWSRGWRVGHPRTSGQKRA